MLSSDVRNRKMRSGSCLSADQTGIAGRIRRSTRLKEPSLKKNFSNVDAETPAALVLWCSCCGVLIFHAGACSAPRTSTCYSIIPITLVYITVIITSPAFLTRLSDLHCAGILLHKQQKYTLCSTVGTLTGSEVKHEKQFQVERTLSCPNYPITL